MSQANQVNQVSQAEKVNITPVPIHVLKSLYGKRLQDHRQAEHLYEIGQYIFSPNNVL